jgi:hypothetical protein
MIFFGERRLRQAIDDYLKHYHGERAHQVIGNKAIERREPGTGEVHLVPDWEDPDEERLILKEFWPALFEAILVAWVTDESLWPKKMSLQMFREWFELEMFALPRRGDRLPRLLIRRAHIGPLRHDRVSGQHALGVLGCRALARIIQPENTDANGYLAWNPYDRENNGSTKRQRIQNGECPMKNCYFSMYIGVDIEPIVGDDQNENFWHKRDVVPPWPRWIETGGAVWDPPGKEYHGSSAAFFHVETLVPCGELRHEVVSAAAPSGATVSLILQLTCETCGAEAAFPGAF